MIAADTRIENDAATRNTRRMVASLRLRAGLAERSGRVWVVFMVAPTDRRPGGARRMRGAHPPARFSHAARVGP